jgi:hypothetical protein
MFHQALHPRCVKEQLYQQVSTLPTSKRDTVSWTLQKVIRLKENSSAATAEDFTFDSK